MTTETPIDLIDRAEINAGGVLVQYSKTEAALAALREKYTGATFDMTTTKGDKEARAARRAEEEVEAERKAQEVITAAAAPAPEPAQAKSPMRTLEEAAPAAANLLKTSLAGFHAPAEADEKPTLKLGDVNARLGFTVTAEFLDLLGFRAHVERSSKLYRESDFPRICAAIVRHVQAVAQPVAA